MFTFKHMLYVDVCPLANHWLINKHATVSNETEMSRALGAPEYGLLF